MDTSKVLSVFENHGEWFMDTSIKEMAVDN